MSEERPPRGTGNAEGWRRVRLLVRPPEVEPGSHRLTATQTHYLTTVLRLRDGETLYPFDGEGREAVAKLREAASRRCSIEVSGPSGYAPADAALRVHVGQGMTARNRLDVAVEKLTEAGAASITPITGFGGPKSDRPAAAGRWRRICESATAQCGRMTVPRIGEAAGVGEWSAQLPQGCLRLFLSPGAGTRLSEAAGGIGPGSEVAVLIGRASGTGADEDRHVEGLGFAKVGLGDRVLRAETVGVVAMGVLLAAAGEY